MYVKRQILFLFSFTAVLFHSPLASNAQLASGWKAHDLTRPLPVVVEPGEAKLPASVPSDAIVLFDGTDLSNWTGPNGNEAGWTVVDGAMESVKGAGYVFSKEKFGDIQLHIEWAAPSKVQGKGQGRGNSGVFLMGNFEIQVLDSFENPTYADGGAGSIYGQFPPLVNASRKPGQWQAYDIIFKTPRFDEAGKLVSPAMVTVLHNGVVIQHGTEPYGPSGWVLHDKYDPTQTTGPIGLQDHGNPVRYRNIWVRKLVEREKRPTAYPVAKPMSAEEQQKYVGKFGSEKVSLKEEKLYLTTLKNKEMELISLGDHTFQLDKSAGTIKFVMGDDGNAIEMIQKLDAGKGGNYKKK
jgi:hypothetical protein